jgi:hypothetical protein
MDFFDKYTVSPIPMGESAAEKSRPTPQERARFRLLQQCDVQKEILTAQKEGREFTLQRNGKNSKPRAFWIKAGDQIAFTPRLGNEFLIEKGHGVLVNNLDKLGEVLADFRSAVEAGGLDTKIMEIVGARNTPSNPTGTKQRGRPRKTDIPRIS